MDTSEAVCRDRIARAKDWLNDYPRVLASHDIFTKTEALIDARVRIESLVDDIERLLAPANRCDAESPATGDRCQMPSQHAGAHYATADPADPHAVGRYWTDSELAESSARDAAAMRSVIRRLLDGWEIDWPIKRWTNENCVDFDGTAIKVLMTDAERAVIDDITAASSGEGE